MDDDSIISLANIVSAEAPSGEEKGFARKGRKKKKVGVLIVVFNGNQIFQSHPYTPGLPVSPVPAEVFVSFA